MSRPSGSEADTNVAAGAAGWSRALVNGAAVGLDEARLAVTDDGVARGDGAFETLGVWNGRPFMPEAHVERIQRSLRAIGLAAPDAETVLDEIREICAPAGDVDAALRVYVTGSGARVLTLTPPPDRPETRSLCTQPAPWIRPLGTYGPAGAKMMSYAPNMAASRAAQRAGFDDALLVSLEGLVLEGPTFCLLWVRDGQVRTPTPELGIVDSISRRMLVELAAEAGWPVEEGRWPLEELAGASEIFVCSSVREVSALRRVDDWRYEPPTPVAEELGAALAKRRRGGG